MFVVSITTTITLLVDREGQSLMWINRETVGVKKEYVEKFLRRRRGRELSGVVIPEYMFRLSYVIVSCLDEILYRDVFYALYLTK